MTSVFVDHPNLSQSDEEAKARFLIAKSTDPFPEIADALLNSADIHDYVRMTGMLFPFHPDKVKSGSYEAAIRGHCIWWNEKGNRQEKLLTRADGDSKDHFILKANSIAFVQVEPSFRLPDYMALRFNLKISHVHRGILLGTGPLVDPGFEGKLLIPLHNLTTNDYTLTCGTGLIWIEFTKTSRLPDAGRSEPNSLGLTKSGIYKEFPPNKKWKEPIYYLSSAFDGPIRSSIPEAVKQSVDASLKSATSAESSKAEAEGARKEAERARGEVKVARRTVQIVAGLVSVALIGTFAAVGISTCSLIQDTSNIARDVQQQLHQEKMNDLSEVKAVEEAVRKIRSVEAKVTHEVTTVRKQLDSLNEEMKMLRDRSKQGKQTGVSHDAQNATR